jgi:stage V sporulation protein R
MSNRDMVESMSATADRIAGYSVTYGTDAVESFIDSVLAIQEHIDPSLIQPRKLGKTHLLEAKMKELKDAPPGGSKSSNPYDELWNLDKSTTGPQEAPSGNRAFPPEPEKDMVWFIQQYSTVLEDWQRDIMTMLHDEMLYFWPQMETKIMNEGWASYWHQRIVRELDLTEEETVEYAKLNSSVVQPSRQSLNPYYLGLKIFEDIERRWDREKIFEVRELESDTSFIRSYLSKELVNDLDLYVFEKKGPEWKITDKAWENVRDQLVLARVNGGSPYLVIEDADFEKNGELFITHRYESIELDLKYLERTLPHIYSLWGRTVHLQTVVEDKKARFSYDGKKVQRKFI